MVNMSQRDIAREISIIYEQFRQQILFRIIPSNLILENDQDIYSLKSKLLGRRRLEQVFTVGDLLKELEKQLVVFPERGELESLGLLIKTIPPNKYLVGLNLLGHFEALQQKISFLLRSQQSSQPPQRPQTPPARVIEMLAHSFDSTQGGDWERFIEGLATVIKPRHEDEVDLVRQVRERVKIRPGEVDQIEAANPDTRSRLVAAICLFSERCQQQQWPIDIPPTIVAVLKSKEVFGDMTYNRLAREISETAL